MDINILALPPLLMSAICAYVGVHHFFVFIQRTQQREKLYFSLCCVCITLYAYFCFRLYCAHDFASGAHWQRLQLATMCAMSPTFLWFIGCFVKVKSFRPIIAISAVSCVFLLLGLLVTNEWTLDYSRPSIKSIRLGGLAITYFEASLGPILQLQFAFYVAVMVYFTVICIKYRKNYRAKYAKLFFISNALFILSVLNDMLVSGGLYQFIYITEYTYMLIIITMAFILSGQFADLYDEIEAMNISLEQKIKERTKELVEKAHKAGMADIATETLHNVGNILNSINASVEAMRVAVRESPFQGVVNANKLLRDNSGRLGEFISADPRGVKLLHYFLKIDGPLKDTIAVIDQNLNRLADKVSSIGNVITAQQSYAGVGGFSEIVQLSDIVDDVLLMESGSIDRNRIAVLKNYSEVPNVTIQKAKLVHILVNVIANAKRATAEYCPGEKTLSISIARNDAGIFVRITDNGCGISPENLTKIFSYGFTTKKDGHGFGLHSCANYMKEMGGEMWAESDGEGKGATFVLKFTRHAERGK